MKNQTPQQTGKIAKTKVCEELMSRGYSIKKRDTQLLVESPNSTVFKVKVTSLFKPNFGLINCSPKDNDYYFALVFMPRDNHQEFFILNATELLKEKENYLKARRKPLNEYKNPELEKLGLGFKQPFPYKDKWSSLPG
jgi:hypothetical protein